MIYKNLTIILQHYEKNRAKTPKNTPFSDTGTPPGFIEFLEGSISKTLS